MESRGQNVPIDVVDTIAGHALILKLPRVAIQPAQHRPIHQPPNYTDEIAALVRISNIEEDTCGLKLAIGSHDFHDRVGEPAQGRLPLGLLETGEHEA